MTSSLSAGIVPADQLPAVPQLPSFAPPVHLFVATISPPAFEHPSRGVSARRRETPLWAQALSQTMARTFFGLVETAVLTVTRSVAAHVTSNGFVMPDPMS